MKEQRQQQMLLRTKRFALEIISLYASLPKSVVGQVLGRQVLRSGTSVGAHYREACRAKSNADFIGKIEGALQELDETAYWLDLMREAAVVDATKVEPLMSETQELLAIFVSVAKSVKTLGKRK